EREEQPANDDSEQGGKEREIADEQCVDQDRHHHRESAVCRHHRRNPVEGEREVEKAGRETHAERAKERELTAADERGQQRRERDPTACRVTELGKTEGEQNARGER